MPSPAEPDCRTPMCDGSDPRWLVWGQWQAPLPQFSFLLDSVDHLTIHSFGANAKPIGTIGMIHDASGSLASNYDAQSLRFALEALSLSLRALRSSMSLEVGKAVAEQRSQVLKQVQDDSYARTCFTGRLLWGPQQCRWKRVLWFIYIYIDHCPKMSKVIALQLTVICLLQSLKYFWCFRWVCR